MTDTKTVDYLIKLFGNKAGPIPESVRYSVTINTYLENANLKGLLEEDLGFKNATICERDETGRYATVEVPYAIVRKKQKDGYLDGNGIIHQILANPADPRTRIHIPIPDDIGTTPSELAEHLSETFGFMTEVKAVDEKLVVDIPQFQTLYHEWLRHAEIDGREASAARFLDQMLSEENSQAHGTAKSDTDRTLEKSLAKMLEIDPDGIDLFNLFADDSDEHDDKDKGNETASVTKEAIRMAEDPSEDQFHLIGNKDKPNENVIATIDTSGKRPVVKPGPKAKEVSGHSKGIDGVNAPNVEQVDFRRKR